MGKVLDRLTPELQSFAERQEKNPQSIDIDGLPTALGQKGYS